MATQTKVSDLHLPQELLNAFQGALNSAKNENDKRELEDMMRDATDKLADNEMEGKEIADKLRMSLNEVQKRMKMIRRVHNEKKDADAEIANLPTFTD